MSVPSNTLCKLVLMSFQAPCELNQYIQYSVLHNVVGCRIRLFTNRSWPLSTHQDGTYRTVFICIMLNICSLYGGRHLGGGRDHTRSEWMAFSNFCPFFLHFHLFWGSIPSKLGSDLSKRAGDMFKQGHLFSNIGVSWYHKFFNLCLKLSFWTYKG